MASFADTALALPTPPNATPLHVVRAADYSAWSREQPRAGPPVARFHPSSRRCGNDRVVAGRSAVAPFLRWLAAMRSMRRAICRSACLPVTTARSRFRTRPTLTVLGWGLGAYRYTRYKSAERAPARLLVPNRATPRCCAINSMRPRWSATSSIRRRPTCCRSSSPRRRPRWRKSSARVATSSSATICSRRTSRRSTRSAAPAHDAPRLIDLDWGNASDPHVTLVGKGVCFDSGGLDIKPSDGMRLMKKDMGGAAHVLALARW